MAVEHFNLMASLASQFAEFILPVFYFIGFYLLLEVINRLLQFVQHIGNLRRYDLATIQLPFKMAIGIERLSLDFQAVKLDLLSSFLGMACVSSAIVTVLNYMFNPSAYILYLLSAIFALAPWTLRADDRQLAVGLAWSFYFGYLRLLLPHMVSERQRWRDKDGVWHNIVGWFILIPSDAKTPAAIKDKNDRIVRKENYPPIKIPIAGQERVFKLSVYEVVSDNADCNFHCFMEYATPLRNLSSLADPKQKYRDHAKFGEAERVYQSDLFMTCLENILQQCEKDLLQNCSFRLKDFLQFVPVGEDGTDIASEVIKRRWQMKDRSFEQKRVEQNPVTTTALPATENAFFSGVDNSNWSMVSAHNGQTEGETPLLVPCNVMSSDKERRLYEDDNDV